MVARSAFQVITVHEYGHVYGARVNDIFVLLNVHVLVNVNERSN